MKMRMLVAAVSVGALAVTACASSVPVETGATPNTSMSTSGGNGRTWSGRIASVTQSRGDVAQSTRDRSYGSADWTVGNAPTLSVVNMTFTYAGNERDLNWAIIAGNCGMAALPLIPLSNFPELNVGSGGRAQVTATLPIDLPTTGSYHIDIYRDRNGGTASLVACGTLKYRDK